MLILPVDNLQRWLDGVTTTFLLIPEIMHTRTIRQRAPKTALQCQEHGTFFVFNQSKPVGAGGVYVRHGQPERYNRQHFSAPYLIIFQLHEGINSRTCLPM